MPGAKRSTKADSTLADKISKRPKLSQGHQDADDVKSAYLRGTPEMRKRLGTRLNAETATEKNRKIDATAAKDKSRKTLASIPKAQSDNTRKRRG